MNSVDCGHGLIGEAAAVVDEANSNGGECDRSGAYRSSDEGRCSDCQIGCEAAERGGCPMSSPPNIIEGTPTAETRYAANNTNINIIFLRSGEGPSKRVRSASMILVYSERK